MTRPVGGVILLTQLRADYEQQRLHLMRKYGIGLEDNPRETAHERNV
jgi:hypothetical protein